MVKRTITDRGGSNKGPRPPGEVSGPSSTKSTTKTEQRWTARRPTQTR